MVEAVAARLSPASVGQAELVLDFWRTSAEDSGRPTDDLAAIGRLIERDGDALMLAWDGEDLVGTLIAGWDGWRFHLYRLAVHPDHRRQGIAHLLLSAAEARFTAAGATRADAMVLDDNAGAHGFWVRAGYAPQRDWSRWVKQLTAAPRVQ